MAFKMKGQPVIHGTDDHRSALREREQTMAELARLRETRERKQG